jgi:WD repeat-containing protein 23
MAASGTVESEANVTDIHEALHFDVLEADGDDGFQRGFGIWSLAWAANGTEVVAGTGDDSLYLYNMERQKVSRPGT